MIAMLKPNEEVKSFDKLNLKKLKKMGFKGLILDVDGTLMHNKGKFIPAKIEKKLNDAKKLKFNLAIITNTTRKRKREVEKIFHKYTKIVLNFPRKPMKGVFKKVEKLTGVPLKKQVVIGDRYFTDILGGNRVGCYTILIKKGFSEKDDVYTRIMKKLENFSLRIFKARKIP